MNNNYFSSPINQYSTSYDYSYDYLSPSTSSYFYSPMVPSTTAAPSCPIHSPYNYYPSMPSMNVSPVSYSYYSQQEQQQFPVQMQVYLSPPVDTNVTNIPATDRTPLRRHKCFKKNELQILHQTYNRDPHPSTDALQQLAMQLRAPIDKVRQWFKNRRHSDKQKKRELPTERSSTTN